MNLVVLLKYNMVKSVMKKILRGYMATKNDITGDSIQTRGVTDTYRSNYDLIWGKKKKEKTDDVKVEENNESSDSNTDNRE